MQTDLLDNNQCAGGIETGFSVSCTGKPFVVKRCFNGTAQQQQHNNNIAVKHPAAIYAHYKSMVANDTTQAISPDSYATTSEDVASSSTVTNELSRVHQANGVVDAGGGDGGAALGNHCACDTLQKAKLVNHICTADQQHLSNGLLNRNDDAFSENYRPLLNGDAVDSNQALHGRRDLKAAGTNSFNASIATPTTLRHHHQSHDGSQLSDDLILQLLRSTKLKPYSVENFVHDADRSVRLRRLYYGDILNAQHMIDKIPYANYPYAKVHRVCGENIVGYIPVACYKAGPLLMDGQQLHVPLATSDRTLVSSVNRGFHALLESSGVASVIVKDGMTRAPALRFATIESASRAVQWIQQAENFRLLKSAFDSTSRFAKLNEITPCLKDRDLYLRFVAFTGDAMGMNMVSKGVEKALQLLRTHFPDIETIVLSGNYCIDKKVSCLNWIEGRGKIVVCEAKVPSSVLERAFGASARLMVRINDMRPRGVEMLGSVGSFNSRASAIVAAIFTATGQDVAQVGTSSMCLVTIERCGSGNGDDDDQQQDLYISCRMPSLEVGTVGGGTVLDAQGAALDMIGVRGGAALQPGDNARRLSQVICASVLAGELALLGDLAVTTAAGAADNQKLLVPSIWTSIPLGLAGPLLLDDKTYTVPLATTEGALIASINRGFKAINSCGGVCSKVNNNNNRSNWSCAVAVRFQRLCYAAAAEQWLQQTDNLNALVSEFKAVAPMQSVAIMPFVKDRDLYLQFTMSPAGADDIDDSLHLRLTSAGATKAAALLCRQFAAHVELMVPSEHCSPALSAHTVRLLNSVDGDGKNVVCEAVIRKSVVESILKSTVSSMIQVNKIKNNGSDLAGSIGGFNCQAANIVAAMFLATGQNVAYIGTSSLCTTTVDRCGDHEQDLYISCRMPSLAVGVEDGTSTELEPYVGVLGVLGLERGDAARWQRLARIICATVLAGELSLLAALSEGTLVKSHEQLNRKKSAPNGLLINSAVVPVAAEAAASGDTVLLESGFVHSSTT